MVNISRISADFHVVPTNAHGKRVSAQSFHPGCLSMQLPRSQKPQQQLMCAPSPLPPNDDVVNMHYIFPV